MFYLLFGLPWENRMHEQEPVHPDRRHGSRRGGGLRVLRYRTRRAEAVAERWGCGSGSYERSGEDAGVEGRHGSS